MKITSQEANKLLRKLNDDYTAITEKEQRSKEFNAAMGEDIESVRPVYSYSETQAELHTIEGKIRKLKHAINLFNTQTVIDGFDMTVDEMLVYIPQLTKEKSKLYQMKSRLPKERESDVYSRTTTLIDYRYANYSIEEVEKDYENVSDRLSKAQTALDVLNNTKKFDFDF